MKNEKWLAQVPALANTSLLGYAKLQYRQYLDGQFIRKIARNLELVESGQIKRLIIEAPPRHGKTMLVSEFFPSWYMAKNPHKEVIYGTYNQTAANKVGRKVRNQIISPLVKACFPMAQLSGDSKAKNHFTMTERGEYNAMGVDGPTAGKGAHLVILDDTLKGHKEAKSKAHREMIKEWFRADISTRLYEDAAMVIMQTRWNEDDLIGYVLKEHAQQGWMRLKFPATNPEETLALFPERFSLKRLMEIKEDQGPYNWASLFMQNPVPIGGNIFKTEWWKFYVEPPKYFDRIIQSWDMSFKAGDDNSFVVGQVWGKKGPNSFLLFQYRKQIGFTETLTAFKMVCDMYPKAHKKLIEDKANGPGIIDVMKRRVPGIVAVPANGSKPERASAISPMVQSGCVYIPDPKQQPWVLDFISEHANFPKSDFDDQVDATSQALSELYEFSGTDYNILLQD